MNSVTLIGNLGADPTRIDPEARKAVTRFSLATKDGAQVEWHKIVCFDRQAETCVEFLQKGSLCAVQGRLQTSDWVDRDGNTRKTTEIIAFRVQFLGRKEATERVYTDINTTEDVPF